MDKVLFISTLTSFYFPNTQTQIIYTTTQRYIKKIQLKKYPLKVKAIGFQKTHFKNVLDASLTSIIFTVLQLWFVFYYQECFIWSYLSSIVLFLSFFQCIGIRSCWKSIQELESSIHLHSIYKYIIRYYYNLILFWYENYTRI